MVQVDINTSWKDKSGDWLTHAIFDLWGALRIPGGNQVDGLPPVAYIHAQEDITVRGRLQARSGRNYV